MIHYEGEETMVIQYNKLVRDRIPEIIESSGKSCTTEILSAEDYLRMLDAKLDEELAEYHKDQNIEELADLLEVIRAAAIASGYTIEDVPIFWVNPHDQISIFALIAFLDVVFMDFIVCHEVTNFNFIGANP